MAKTKSARLSLTLPNSIHLPGAHALSPTTSSNINMGSPGIPRRKQDFVVDSNGYVMDDASTGFIPIRPILPVEAPSPEHHTLLAAAVSPSSPISPTFTSLPSFPSSPGHTSRHARDPSKSFFSNLKASKSSHKLQSPESTIRKVNIESSQDMPFRTKKSSPTMVEEVLAPTEQGSLSDTQQPHPAFIVAANTSGSHPTSRRHIGGLEKTSTDGPNDLAENVEGRRKDSSMFSSIMRRNHSNRPEDASQQSHPSTPTQSRAPEFHDNNLAPRNRSTTRNPSPHSDPGGSDTYAASGYSSSGPQLNNQRSQVFRDGGVLSGLRKKTAKAAGGINRAGNRFFKPKPPTKLDEPPPNYQCTVITQPLVEQTRITRIARRLEDSRDKTEFWMPALPWRCIDYLNFKGTEAEGLYRVPGSDLQVRHWKWKFDIEYDCDLFEVEELYDVNIVGSLFKAWLRDIPDEILPKTTQDRLTEAAGGAENAPQMLKDELSRLPPWNYYLLFAITCHLSLLNTCADKNKMTYNNLFICFAPALKMNNDCFRWLVTDWRNCWQGCWTEKEYLDQEYAVLDSMDLGGSTEMLNSFVHSGDDRALSSSGSGSTSHRPPVLDLVYPDEEQLSPPASNTQHGRNASQLPELALPQPISPFYNAEHSH